MPLSSSRIQLLDLLGLALAVGLATVVLLAFHDRSWVPADEGNYAHVAERMLDGEVLNRDVQDVHAGAINVTNAVALAIGGRRLVSLRYPLIVLGVLEAAAVWLLFRRRFGSTWGVLAAWTWTAFGIVLYLDPTSHWYCQALFMALVVELELMTPSHRLRPLLVGLTLGAMLLFRQLTGVLVGIGAVAYLLAESATPGGEVGRAPTPRAGGSLRSSLARTVVAIGAIGLAGYLAVVVGDAGGIALFGLGSLGLLVLAFARARVGARVALRRLGGVVGGIGLAFLPLLAYHVAHGSLASWTADVVGAAVGLAGAQFIASQRYLDSLVGGGLATLLAARGLREAVNGVFWAALPFAALAQAAWLVWRLRDGRSALAPLPFLAPFYAVIALHYQIPIYLVLSLGTTAVALLWLTCGLPRRSRAVGATVLAGFGLVAVAFHAGEGPSRRWDDLLAGARSPLVAAPEIARLGLRIDPAERDFYRRLLTVIDVETTPGDTIFVAPSSAELYFLSMRRNPTRFFNSALGMRDAAAARAVAVDLRETPPRLLIYDLDDKYATPPLRELLSLLADLYEPLPPIGRFTLMRLRASAPPVAEGTS